MSKYTKEFTEITVNDVAIVGGKNASLGEMYSRLSSLGVQVPNGFATTASAYWDFLDKNNLREQLINLLLTLDRNGYKNLHQVGEAARSLILNAKLPDDLIIEIKSAYRTLCGNADCSVAVRSSATAEDLPEASFAGQHESYLNIQGEEAVTNAVLKCFASLYTDRAIKYREDNGFQHDKIALSAGIQTMVRSDMACSGIMFTLEPESGFRDVIQISGTWGLGENIVQGVVTPDEYFVFKPTFKLGKNGIIQKRIGEKEKTMVFAAQGAEKTVISVPTAAEKRKQSVLNDQEISVLAQWAIVIEKHYAKPMDIEWAKDGVSGELYIIQARPETVHGTKNPSILTEHTLVTPGEKIVTGEAVGSDVAYGIARVIRSPKDGDSLKKGEIVVTDITSPDWDPILKKAAAIITDKGGRTSHASIVARELGVPAIVGCQNAMKNIKDGEGITVSCCEGRTGVVYRGKVEFTKREIDFSKIKRPHTDAMLILADPEKAFKFSFYPNSGVGLLRMEFIVNHTVRIHPMALVKYKELKDAEARKLIDEITYLYEDKKKFFVDTLAEGIATIAAAFYPKKVILRMSDFKTNEYANLIGGKGFEPAEENPMLGFRGASRYYNELYKEGFALECEAVKKVRNEMGLDNVKIMIPFCRTVDEGWKVLETLKENGLDREADESLKIYMMVEIPSNVLQEEEFAEIFDGFSIGSNDLTQLTLGVDRDSHTVSKLFSELNASAKQMVSTAIQKARSSNVPIGLCGQAPSDFPEYAEFLVKEGIDNISFNPDALLKGIENILRAEQKLHMTVS